MSKQQTPLTTSLRPQLALLLLVLLCAVCASRAILVQPHNFAPEEQDHAELTFFEQRLRDARMLAAAAAAAAEEPFSAEMADLIQREHQHQIEKQANDAQQEPSLSASVAHVLMNVARAAAQAQANDDQEQSAAAAAATADAEAAPPADKRQASAAARNSAIMELDTSSIGGQSQPSKADLKQSGPKQWFNPKETIPVLKISSMGEFIVEAWLARFSVSR